jgi:hypothetical protein
MEINLDLGLVSGQFDESNVDLDADMNVTGTLSLTGAVDEDWVAAFEAAGPADAPWGLDDTGALRFGPIPVREFAACVVMLRNQINAANESVEVDRHKQAMAAFLDAEERARAHRQAIDALSSVFGRRLRSHEESGLQPA